MNSFRYATLYLAHNFAALFIILLLENCSPNSDKKIIDCKSKIDSISVSKGQNRGMILLKGGLILPARIEPFDQQICLNDFFDHFDSKNNNCVLGDLSPPYIVKKSAGSDTLVVIKNKFTILFRIPEDVCNPKPESKFLIWSLEP